MFLSVRVTGEHSDLRSRAFVRIPAAFWLPSMNLAKPPCPCFLCQARNHPFACLLAFPESQQQHITLSPESRLPTQPRHNHSALLPFRYLLRMPCPKPWPHEADGLQGSAPGGRGGKSEGVEIGGFCEKGRWDPFVTNKLYRESQAYTRTHGSMQHHIIGPKPEVQHCKPRAHEYYDRICPAEQSVGLQLLIL
ncbi:hypothetical protein LY76DRAFT_85992 [Colletotrichum caudatum]|nr:hypothetical protein LY76DRAFT_85992 [Colletotrichum caudatum]